jgi:hypothetical protein
MLGFTLLEYRDEVAMDRQCAVSIDSSDPSLIQTLSVTLANFCGASSLNLRSKRTLEAIENGRSAFVGEAGASAAA